MTNIVWKEFPEINRKVAFTYNFQPMKGDYLGCHCGTISGLYVTFGTGYYAANGGVNIDILDKTKEPNHKISYRSNQYGGYPSPPKDEIDRVVKHMKEIKLSFENIVDGAYKDLIDRCSGIPLWVMSDVINGEAPARKIDTSIYGGNVYEVFGKTADFADYLITNKIGYVLASPIIQNPAHRQNNNYSLNQGWFWVHPKHMSRAIDVAEAYGEDQFPSKEEWLETVGKDLWTAKVEKEGVARSVFNSGVFPDDKRFRRRNEKGQFAKGA